MHTNKSNYQLATIELQGVQFEKSQRQMSVALKGKGAYIFVGIANVFNTANLDCNLFEKFLNK